MATVNMNLTVPVVGPGGTQGPTWATDLNTDLDLIDLHDHSTGKGVKITPAGININQDLSINSYQLTSVDQLGLINKTGTQPTAASRIYEFGGELFFNDGSGNQVQLTSGGAIDVSSLGTITGDYSTSTADLSYVNLSKDFIFRQSATLTANISCGPIKIYRNVASSPYAQIQLNASQAGNLDWTLPVAYPASTLPVKSSSAGVLSMSQILTAEIGDSQITTAKIADTNVTTAKIANDAVVESKIASNAISTNKIIDAQVTKAKLASQTIISSGNINFGTSSTAVIEVPGSPINITTSGRPVMLMIAPNSSSTDSYLSVTDAGTSKFANIYINRNGADIAKFSFGTTALGGSFVYYIPPSSVTYVDQPGAAGTYTYTLRINVAAGTSTVSLSTVKYVAYEL